jgi:hypothetical protein
MRRERIRNLSVIALTLILFEKTLCQKELINYNQKGIPGNENSINGTGNEMKDVVYMSKCLLLKCQSSCCEGSIEEMKCGTQERCDNFLFKENIKKIMYGSALSLMTLIIFLLALSGYYAKSHPQRSQKILQIILVFISIIFFPIAIPIWLVYKLKCKVKPAVKIHNIELEIDTRELSIRIQQKKLDKIEIDIDGDKILTDRQCTTTDNVILLV